LIFAKSIDEKHKQKIDNKTLIKLLG